MENGKLRIENGDGAGGFHPTAWLLWIGAAALPALMTRNPLYLILIGVAVGMVYAGLPGRRSPLAASWLGLVKLGAFLTLFAVPMNALTVHSGRLVLFTLPAAWPVIGGPITGEAVLFGLSTSISLTVILLIFATLNVAIDQSTLLRLAPPFLVEAGVIVAIAVGFIPQMVRSFHDIREAQTLRGHRFDGGRLGGLRQLGPLFVALLTTGPGAQHHLGRKHGEPRFWGKSSAAPDAKQNWGPSGRPDEHGRPSRWTLSGPISSRLGTRRVDVGRPLRGRAGGHPVAARSPSPTLHLQSPNLAAAGQLAGRQRPPRPGADRAGPVGPAGSLCLLPLSPRLPRGPTLTWPWARGCCSSLHRFGCYRSRKSRPCQTRSTASVTAPSLGMD